MLRGPQGERNVPLGEFFAPPTEERRTENVLASDELIVAVEIPRPAPGTRSTYLKAMDRKVWAFALVGVAAAARVEGGSVVDARVVLSGVAPIPWRVPAAEQALTGGGDVDAAVRAAETKDVSTNTPDDGRPAEKSARQLREELVSDDLIERLVQQAGAEGVEWGALEEASADNLKRVLRPGGDSAEAVEPDFTATPDLSRLTAFLETKTVWHPKGR